MSSKVHQTAQQAKQFLESLDMDLEPEDAEVRSISKEHLENKLH